MGKGDKRTKRGKIYKGSYGKSRPHKATKKKK
jgi:30S ribosomal protein S31